MVELTVKNLLFFLKVSFFFNCGCPDQLTHTSTNPLKL